MSSGALRAALVDATDELAAAMWAGMVGFRQQCDEISCGLTQAAIEAERLATIRADRTIEVDLDEPATWVKLQTAAPSYGPLPLFYSSLPPAVGLPASGGLQGLAREHTAHLDSDVLFTDGQTSITTSSRFEWLYVAEPRLALEEIGLDDWIAGAAHLPIALGFRAVHTASGPYFKPRIEQRGSHFTLHISHLILYTPPSHTFHTSYFTIRISRLTPHISHLTPHTSHLTPHTSNLKPHTAHLTPHTSYLTPHTSHLTPHTSTFTGIDEINERLAAIDHPRKLSLEHFYAVRMYTGPCVTKYHAVLRAGRQSSCDAFSPEAHMSACTLPCACIECTHRSFPCIVWATGSADSFSALPTSYFLLPGSVAFSRLQVYMFLLPT